MNIFYFSKINKFKLNNFINYEFSSKKSIIKIKFELFYEIVLL